MKSFNMNFDNFLIPEDSLIGNHEGNGFKQLMNTFENAKFELHQDLMDCQRALNLH